MDGHPDLRLGHCTVQLPISVQHSALQDEIHLLDASCVVFVQLANGFLAGSFCACGLLDLRRVQQTAEPISTAHDPDQKDGSLRARTASVCARCTIAKAISADSAVRAKCAASFSLTRLFAWSWSACNIE